MWSKIYKKVVAMLVVIFIITFYIPYESSAKQLQIVLKLEKPTGQVLAGDTVNISGYAVATDSMSKVNIYLDSKMIGQASYGSVRNDVAKLYKTYPNASKSGFTYTLNAKLYSDGLHLLKIEAVDRKGNKTAATVNIQIQNQKTSIVGKSEVSKEQMISYFKSKVLTKDSKYMENFITTIIDEANKENIRADVVFAQIMKETNFFKFTGTSIEKQNNFGNLGDLKGSKNGASFIDVKTGIRAVVQHLKAYATKDKPKLTIVSPRYQYVMKGCAPYVEWLGVKENPYGVGWSTKARYGYDIVEKLKEMKSVKINNGSSNGTGSKDSTSSGSGTSTNTTSKTLKGKTIIIDPGHGGYDPGAVKGKYVEKDLNIQLTSILVNKLTTLGAKIIYTRDSTKDTYVSLDNRTKLANKNGADLFISVHHDATQSSSVSGTSTYYSSYKPGVDSKDVYIHYQGGKYSLIKAVSNGFCINYKGKEKFINSNDATAIDYTPSEESAKSAKLAKDIVDSISSLGLKNRGAQDRNLYVTKYTNMPSVLIEAGFITNPIEAAKLATGSFQEQIATKIAGAVAGVFKN